MPLKNIVATVKEIKKTRGFREKQVRYLFKYRAHYSMRSFKKKYYSSDINLFF